MMRYIAGCLCLVLLTPYAPATAQEKVDLELILMADGSGSINDNEFILQRMGYVRALRHPTILRAIRGGRLGRIALSYVPWTVIHTRQDLEAFAAKLETHPRELYSGGTALGDAILFGMQSLKTNKFDAPRLVIDISGDGPDRNGLDAVTGRDKAVAAGITINGLPILDGWPGLDRFFYDNVIGGPGAFVESARGFKDVYYAVRRKMIREISALPPPAKTPEKTPTKAPTRMANE
jgi:hypothetical protein